MPARSVATMLSALENNREWLRRCRSASRRSPYKLIGQTTGERWDAMTPDERGDARVGSKEHACVPPRARALGI
jgi:hypothetical protein